jgi:hypothetical protein
MRNWMNESEMESLTAGLGITTRKTTSGFGVLRNGIAA